MSPRLRWILANAACAASIAMSIGAQVPVTPRRDTVPSATVTRLPPILVSGRVQPTEQAWAGDTFPTWPLFARRAMLDSLAAGRRRWEANHPASYRIAAGIGCGFCGVFPPGTYPLARVHGRDVFAEGTFHPIEKIDLGDPLAVSVDSLFRLLEQTANDTTRKITELKLDPVFGLPREWSTDGARNGYRGMTVTDQDDWGRVLLFTPDESPTPCGWWRRMLRSCPAPYPPLDSEIRTRFGVERTARPAAGRQFPRFPAALQRARVDGIVREQCAVDALGHVIWFNTLHTTNGEFTSAVEDVMERWAFTPARAQGRPVAYLYEEVFEFRAPRFTHSPDASASGDIPYAVHDTMPDGIPRTIIGFRPRGG